MGLNETTLQIGKLYIVKASNESHSLYSVYKNDQLIKSSFNVYAITNHLKTNYNISAHNIKLIEEM